MSKKLLFAMAIAAVAGNGDVYKRQQTVTTQNYVDTNFQTKIPAAGTNAATLGNTIVTYTDNAGTIGERQFFTSSYNAYVPMSENPTYSYVKDRVPTMNSLNDALKWSIPANGIGNGVKNAPSGERVHYLPEFSDTAGRLYRIRTVNSMDESIGSLQRYNVIPTLAALDSGMETKQDKMTCARYITGAEETSENCLLWNLPD